MQFLIHYFLHFGFPLFIAYVFFKSQWLRIYLIFIATMLVDMDHFFAEPIFQTNRCSINFHPLHSYYAMIAYVALLFFRNPFNIIGLGLLLHMATDLIDCLMIYSDCNECLYDAPALNLVKSISSLLGNR